MGSPLHGSGAQLNLSASSVSAALHLESLHQQALGRRVTRATKGDCRPCSSSELCQGGHLASYSPVHGERKPGNSRLLPFCVFVCVSLFVPFQYFSKSSSAFISDSHCLRDYARKSQTRARTCRKAMSVLAKGLWMWGFRRSVTVCGPRRSDEWDERSMRPSSPTGTSYSNVAPLSVLPAVLRTRLARAPPSLFD